MPLLSALKRLALPHDAVPWQRTQTTELLLVVVTNAVLQPRKQDCLALCSSVQAQESG